MCQVLKTTSKQRTAFPPHREEERGTCDLAPRHLNLPSGIREASRHRRITALLLFSPPEAGTPPGEGVPASLPGHLRPSQAEGVPAASRCPEAHCCRMSSCNGGGQGGLGEWTPWCQDPLVLLEREEDRRSRRPASPGLGAKLQPHSRVDPAVASWWASLGWSCAKCPLPGPSVTTESSASGENGLVLHLTRFSPPHLISKRGQKEKIPNQSFGCGDPLGGRCPSALPAPGHRGPGSAEHVCLSVWGLWLQRDKRERSRAWKVAAAPACAAGPAPRLPPAPSALLPVSWLSRLLTGTCHLPENLEALFPSFFLIEVQSVCTVVSVSGAQRVSVTRTHTHVPSHVRDVDL